MARHRFLLIPFLSLVTSPVWSQTAAPALEATPEATPAVTCTPGPNDGGKIPPEQLREMRRKLENLPPEERDRVMRNFKRMKELPADQKDYVRFMNEQRQKRMGKAIDDVLAASGLKLDDAQRAKFTEIYTRERVQLEQQLRSEMEKRRQELLPTLNQKVTAAYLSQTANGTPAATPAAPVVK